MTSGQKTAFSLLITVSLFAALVVASFLGLFSFIDKKIYEPTKTTQLKNELNQISTAGDEYILNFLSEFGFEKGYMSFSEISLYLNRNRSDGTAKTLSDVNGNLFFNNPGLKGIRIVDVNGKSIHFSTFEKDLLKKDSSKNLVAYKNYDELITSNGNKELPYEVVKANDFKNKNENEYSLIFDSENNRLVFSYPLYYEDYPLIKATVLFYVDGSDFVRDISKKKLISINENVLLLSAKEGKAGGFALGIPNVNQNVFVSEILKRWNETTDFTKIFNAVTETNEKSYIMISSEGNFVKVVGLYEDDIFEISNLVKITLLVCSFITIFLLVFILFNCKQDELLNIKKYVKRFQMEMLSEYFESEELRKAKTPLEHFSDNKDVVFGKIKKGLGSQAVKYQTELDSLLDKSWQEIISVLSNVKTSSEKHITSTKAVVDGNEIKKILEEFFAKGTINVQAVNHVEVKKSQVPIPEAEEVEELEEIPEAEEVEELEEIPEAEEVEEFDEIPEAEEVEELEEIPEAEEVEELEEIPEAEAVEELEEIPEAEAVEELEEIPEAEAVEELEEEIDIDSFGVDESVMQEVKIDFVEPLEVCIEDEVNEEYGDTSIVENFIVELPSLFSLRNAEELPTITEQENQNDFFIPSVESILCDETELEDTSAIKEHENQNDDFSIPSVDSIVCEEIEAETKIQQNEDINMPSEITSSEEISSLKNINQSFSLTSFASCDNVSEIYPDAIVEGEDGVFSISNRLGPSNFAIDEAFKQLVDSVIK